MPREQFRPIRPELGFSLAAIMAEDPLWRGGGRFFGTGRIHPSFYETTGFTDWTHKETKAPMLKMQHPEFEIYNSGIHARSGVACADSHMPYGRQAQIEGLRAAPAR